MLRTFTYFSRNKKTRTQVRARRPHKGAASQIIYQMAAVNRRVTVIHPPNGHRPDEVNGDDPARRGTGPKRRSVIVALWSRCPIQALRTCRTLDAN
jgi:hypothetical protein